MDGFVTADHCSATGGYLDTGDPFYQNSATLVGYEAADPSYSSCYDPQGCRYSDASFVQWESGINYIFGGISVLSSGITLHSTISHWGVFTEATSLVGTVHSKVGQQTGETQGTASHTCIDLESAQTGRMHYCQVRVRWNASLGGSKPLGTGGDSGSPVSYNTYNGNYVAYLFGNLWGVHGDSIMVYSPVANAETDFGSNLTTY